jgi:hypothetical protein
MTESSFPDELKGSESADILVSDVWWSGTVTFSGLVGASNCGYFFKGKIPVPCVEDYREVKLRFMNGACFRVTVNRCEAGAPGDYFGEYLKIAH